jgi:hypothetical protein
VRTMRGLTPPSRIQEKKVPYGMQIVWCKVLEYQMYFGFQLCVPVFGDQMGGKVLVCIAYIVFDQNGQAKYSVAWNHPRVAQQEPVTTFHWGANSDMQEHIITNSKSYTTRSPVWVLMKSILRSLNILGIAGLQQNTGNYIVMDNQRQYVNERMLQHDARP